MSDDGEIAGCCSVPAPTASWGLFPAFFPLLKPAGAVEVLAHRIVWSFLLMVVVVAAVRRLGDLQAISGRTWLLLTAASALISVNWVIYVYAVNNGHVVDAALGYFINPLVIVALGAAHLPGAAQPVAARARWSSRSSRWWC